jgi:hypothetical protein
MGNHGLKSVGLCHHLTQVSPETDFVNPETGNYLHCWSEYTLHIPAIVQDISIVTSV